MKTFQRNDRQGRQFPSQNKGAQILPLKNKTKRACTVVNGDEHARFAPIMPIELARLQQVSQNHQITGVRLAMLQILQGFSLCSPPEVRETPSISGSRAFLVMRYLLHGFGGGGFPVPDNGGDVGIKLCWLSSDLEPLRDDFPDSRKDSRKA